MLLGKIQIIIRTLVFHLKCINKATTNGWINISLNTNIRLRNGGKLHLRGRVTIPDGGMLAAYKGQITIGKDVGINRGCIFLCQDRIEIGDGCAFGPNVLVVDHDHAFDKNGYKMDDIKATPIIIENNCWIGGNVSILRGAHICEGCVIGAGTIVKGYIPPYSLVTLNREMQIMPLRNHI